MVTMCCVHGTKITKMTTMHSETKKLKKKMVSDFDFPFDCIISSALFPKRCAAMHGGQRSTEDSIRELLIGLLQH